MVSGLFGKAFELEKNAFLFNVGNCFINECVPY